MKKIIFYMMCCHFLCGCGAVAKMIPGNSLEIGILFLSDTKIWKEKRDGTPFINTIAVSVVPYIRDAKSSNMRYFLPKDDGGYRLNNELTVNHIEQFPRVLLTPLSSPKGNLQEKLILYLKENIQNYSFKLCNPITIEKIFEIDSDNLLKPKKSPKPIIIMSEIMINIFNELKNSKKCTENFEFFERWNNGGLRICSESNDKLFCDYRPPISIIEKILGKEAEPDSPTKSEPITIGIIFPDTFSNLDITDQIQIEALDETFEVSRDKASQSTTYYIMCEAIPKTLNIAVSGFKEIKKTQIKSTNNSPLIIIGDNEMKAHLKIKMGNNSDIGYVFDKTKIDPREKNPIQIEIPLTDIAKGIVFLPQDTEIGEYCKITKNADQLLDDILHEKEIELQSPCKQNIITWPSEWVAPQIIKAQGVKIKALMSDHIELISDKTQPVNLYLSWGKGWEPIPVSQEELKDELGFSIEMKHLTPRWPLKEDDSLLNNREVTLTENPCEGKPNFEIKNIYYYYNESISKSIHFDPKKPRLPNLRDADWGSDKPLPKEIRISVEDPQNPRYPKQYLKPFLLSQKPLEKDYEQVIGPILPHELPEFAVSIVNNSIPFDMNAEFILFKSKSECEQSALSGVEIQPLKNSVYISQGIEQLKTDICNQWAIIKKGKTPITPCVCGKQSENKLEFEMTSNKIEGARFVIVIADSYYLSDNGMAIKKAMINFLKQQKGLPYPKPLNVFIVTSTSKNEILRGEDIKNLQDESDSAETSIEGKINSNLRFENKGLNVLQDISDIGTKLEKEEIGKVLYLTDSEALPAEPRSIDLGVLMDWKERQIHMTVVTKNNCGIWNSLKNNRKLLINCKEIPQSSDEIEITINDWMQ